MSRKSLRVASLTLGLICVTLISTHAVEGQTTKPRSEAAGFLAQVAGVYKVQFQNGNIDGDKYQSEDILEVVPVDDDAAYVRMDLEFFNGHSGGIYGVATYGSNSLIYDNGKAGDDRCIVEYIWSSGKVVTRADYDKTPGCFVYHGTRGSLSGAEFLVKKKQTIRYMQRLQNSPQFKHAMEEYRKKKALSGR
jgi:hypothetical protein